jgi:ABC-type sugar transport system substrate-binding protein
MSVLYVNPMEGDTNPAIDAISYGLQHSLHRAGVDVRMLYADFRRPDCMALTAAAIDEGVAAGVDAIAFYALDPAGPAEAVARARAAGVPVFTFIRPDFEVDGSVVYPNFNHGLLMAEFLAPLLPVGGGVAVIGGPDTPDDAEEIAGLLYSFRRRGVRVLNDPTDPAWCNLTDVASGGEEVASRLLAAHARIDALVPYNDETMLGALEALTAVGRLGEPIIVSRNGSPEAAEKVRAGITAGTWDLDASGIGTTLGDLVVRQVVGRERLDGFLGISPVGRMITKENVARWKPWSERIDCTPFTVGLEGV